MALVVKNLPAKAGDIETRVQSLGREDPLEERTANPLLPGESYGQRSLAGYSPWGRKESDTTERLIRSNPIQWEVLGNKDPKKQ